jgi:hypothetical protein
MKAAGRWQAELSLSACHVLLPGFMFGHLFNPKSGADMVDIN